MATNQFPTTTYNIDAEKYILGSMLIDGNLAIELDSSFEVDDFYDEKHKIILSAIKKLIKERKQVGPVQVQDELEHQKKIDEVGGLNYLFDLINEVPEVEEVNTYRTIIKEKAITRRLLETTSDIRNDILNGEKSISTIIDESEKKIGDISKNRVSSKFLSMDRAVDKTFDIIESKVNKTEDEDLVLSGYKELDETLHGLGRGALIILAARPSIGKSTFALNIATNVCEAKKSVAFFSLEMGYDQLVTKIFSTTASLNMDKIISGKITSDEMGRLLVTKDKIKEYSMYFDDESSSYLSSIRTKCQELKREKGLDLIVIDYLQLLEDDEKNKSKEGRNQLVSKISRGLKIMARTLDVPIIALSQMSRDIEKSERADKTPRLSDLRESGSIEQDADIVLFLHRERQTDETKKVKSSKTDLIIAKNRNGETKTIKLVFNGALSKFSPYEEEE